MLSIYGPNSNSFFEHTVYVCSYPNVFLAKNINKIYIYTPTFVRGICFSLFQYSDLTAVTIMDMVACLYIVNCAPTYIPLTDLHVQSTSFAFWELKIYFTVL